MVERAERRYSALSERKQQHELSRLGEVEGFITWKAAYLSMDDPMLAEDLAQQAREAVIRKLREAPGCPYSHLVNKARDAIFRYRGKGKSVDGLLYQRGRARQYEIISFEKPIDNEAGPFEETPSLREVLSDPVQPRRVTEERACANVLMDDLRARLSPVENDVLTLRLMEVPWKEVKDILGQGVRTMERMRRNIAENAGVIWSDGVPERAGAVRIDNADGGG